MTIRYLCRYCEVEIGSLPFKDEEAVKKLHLFEVGEIDDYVGKNAEGDTIVQSICEHCEQSVKQYPDYYALKKWLQ